MPAKSRTYQPQKVSAALVAQSEAVRDVVHRLTDSDLDRTTRLGAWKVRELVTHVSLALSQLLGVLNSPEPDGPALPLADYAAMAATMAEFVDSATTEHAETGFAGSAKEVAAEFDRSLDAVRTVLDGPAVADPERKVTFLTGHPMLLTEYLVSRLVEAVVHADDLADALGLDAFPHDPQALAAVSRMLADALAGQVPGGAVELRVPPYAVVQAVPGPKHTRGTPPNVVETDPLTWIRLATGRLDWAAAVESAKVSASGERSDLRAYLPVLG
ncbi:sterol carrier family protein [Kitasatospora sp. NPDC048286]|uniref:maleylpyruvate isomerase family mycothiol-dependent enzyme n=1 Tax=Kitasatospora sp. NPDC048286 TaxID=3364047 RepID=UPI00371B7820